MSSGPERPQALSELSVLLVGGDRLTAASRSLCGTRSLVAGNWEAILDDPPAHFLLVEAHGGVEEAWGDELDRLLGYCGAQNLPRLLWIAGGSPSRYWRDRCHRFERVFTADRAHVHELEAAGAHEPWLLWPAARGAGAGRAHSPSHEERDRTLLWLGGWRQDWPRDWRERLASVLRGGAADRGLRIVPTARLDGLPPDLCEYVANSGDGVDEWDELRRTRVVIAADPHSGSSTLAPRVAFEAAAAGAATITPHDFASMHDFALGGIPELPWRNLVPVVHDGRTAGEEADRLLDDAELWTEVTDHMGRIVANNHTYAHRLATLASAAGYRVVPDVENPAPA